MLIQGIIYISEFLDQVSTVSQACERTANQCSCVRRSRYRERGTQAMVSSRDSYTQTPFYLPEFEGKTLDQMKGMCRDIDLVVGGIVDQLRDVYTWQRMATRHH